MSIVATLAAAVGALAGVMCAWVAWRGHRARRLEGAERAAVNWAMDRGYESGVLVENCVDGVYVRGSTVEVTYERGGGDSWALPPELAIELRGKRSRRSKGEARLRGAEWSLVFMPPEDAERYRLEWRAHLHQLIEEGELRQARRDRCHLAFAGVGLAIAVRVRRAVSRAR